MRSGYTLALASSLTVLTFTSSYAEGDAAEGEKLAREWCTRCHNVEAGGPFKQYPPSFAAIAVYMSPEQIYGQIAFPTLHYGMPQIGYILTPTNMDDLVAYIVTLESQ